MNGKRLATVIAVVAAAVVVVVCLAVFLPRAEAGPEAPQDIMADGVYAEGISVGGVNVAGLTLEQAKIAVNPAMKQMLADGEISFTVPGIEDITYTYTPEQLGVTVDPQPQLEEAMWFSYEGEREKDDDGELVPKDFPLAKSFDQGVVTAEVNRLAETDEWGEDPVNTAYKVKPTTDEDELLTGGELVKTEPADGFTVNTEALAAAIQSQLESGQYSAIEAEMTVVPSNASAGEGPAEMYLMGKYTTEFGDSTAERKFNIWKMATKLNGATFWPGETFSVNDTAGPRDAEHGWKEGLGIENGEYTPQYGGGICQVSSTMYNAALRAEMKIVNRVPHTIAAKYVPKGMDATISTGSPDFKVENTLDDPMYMIIKCNVPEGRITVEIWGPEDRDYEWKYESKLISDPASVAPPPTYKVNPALGPFEVKTITAGQPLAKYQILGSKVNKETGETIESNIEITTSTYPAIAPRYEIGSGVPVPAEGTPIEVVRQSALEASGQVALPAPEEPAPPMTPDPGGTIDPGGSGTTVTAVHGMAPGLPKFSEL